MSSILGRELRSTCSAMWPGKKKRKEIEKKTEAFLEKLILDF